MGRISKFFFIIIVSFFLLNGCASDEEKKLDHLAKGKAYFDKEDFKSAELEFKNVVQIDPVFVDGQINLARVYLKLGKSREAFQGFSRVAELEPDNIEANIKLATFFLLAKKYDDSLKSVEAVLKKEPDNIDALILSANLHLNSDELDKAASEYERVIAIDNKEFKAYIGLSGIYLKQNKLYEAENILKKIIAIDPDVIRPRLTLVKLFMNAREYVQAENEIKEIIKRNPENPNLYIILGDFYASRKKYDAAEDAFKKAIAINSSDLKFHITLAQFYKNTGKREEALSVYMEALKMKEDIRLLNLIAKYYLEERKLDEASDYITRACDKQAGFFPSLLLKGEIEVASRKFDQAVKTLDDAIKQQPGAGRAYLFRALALMGSGKFEEAKKDGLVAVEKNPQGVREKLLMADIYSKTSDFELAFRESEPLLKHELLATQATLIHGISAMALGKDAIALQDFDKLIQLTPDNPESYFRRGLLERKQKNHKKAITDFEKALELFPDSPRVFVNLIYSYGALGEMEKAVAKCDEKLKAVADNKDFKAVLLNLKGNLLLSMNEPTQAKEVFEKAIASNPDYLPPYYAIARLHMRDKNEMDAIKQFNLILKKKPGQVVPHMILGTIYEMQKNLEMSEKHYREALKIKSDFVPAANNLAYMLAEGDKNIDEALEFARTAKAKASDDPNVADTLGWIYYKKGLYDSAVGEFRDSLKKLPDNALVNYHLGLALYRKGDTQKAKEVLEQALDLDGNFDGADNARSILSRL